MKEAKILSQNDLYLVRRIAAATADLAERCGVDGAARKVVKHRKKKAAPKPAARGVAPVTRPVPRQAAVNLNP